MLRLFKVRNNYCIDIEGHTHYIHDIEILENSNFINLLIKRKRINYLGKPIRMSYPIDLYVTQIKELNDVG